MRLQTAFEAAGETVCLRQTEAFSVHQKGFGGACKVDVLPIDWARLRALLCPGVHYR
jgi:hypothetical protein